MAVGMMAVALVTRGKVKPKVGKASSSAMNMEKANAARDELASKLGRKHATYAAGEKNGKIASGCSGGGKCAEDVIAEQLGSDAKMTAAKGYRRNKETGELEYRDIPVCVRCQSKYKKEQFPKDVKYDKGGAWDE